MDAVLLAALRADPAAFPAYFAALAQLPGDVFARFMTDAAGAGDQPRVMRVLPAGSFARAAARVALSRA